MPYLGRPLYSRVGRKAAKRLALLSSAHYHRPFRLCRFTCRLGHFDPPRAQPFSFIPWCVGGCGRVQRLCSCLLGCAQ